MSNSYSSKFPCMVDYWSQELKKLLGKDINLYSRESLISWIQFLKSIASMFTETINSRHFMQKGKGKKKINFHIGIQKEFFM